MRHSLFILPLIALTACATPQERCINNVSREINTINGLISVTQGNIDRGFAIKTEERTTQVRRTCTGETESGEEVRVRCDRTLVRDVKVPVTINIEEERTKLAQLQARQRALTERSGSAVAQCRAQFPDS